MKSIAEMTQGELAAFVQTHLRERGIEAILSGGASVSIYSSGKYVSLDIDLVNVYFVRRLIIQEAMSEIEFQEKGRHFIHPDTQFFIEFPPGPLSVGQEPVDSINEIEFSTGILKLISPTDCVKDRLLAYFYWGDQQCLAQAILVAQENDIDFEEIERWSIVEGKLEDFRTVRTKLMGE
ncbi:MAG: hypothetical protein FJ010_06945 [Chloroflexi bacterium]|nr:hypothetical protein [Chloroflexota bacterium]